MKTKATKRESAVLLQLFLRLSKSYRKKIYLAWSLIAVSVGMTDIVGPIIVSKILGDVASKAHIESIKPYLVFIYILIALEVVSLVIRRISSYLEERFDAHCRRAIITDIFTNLLEQPVHFHQNRFVGKTITLISKTADCFGRLSGMLHFNIVPFTVVFIGMGIVLIPKVPIYFLVVIVFSCIYVFVIRKLLPKQMELSAQASEVSTKIFGSMSDALSNITAVKSEANEEQERGNVLDIGSDWLKINRRFARRVIIRDGILSSSFIRSLRVLCIVFALIASVGHAANVSNIYLATTLTLMYIAYLWDLADNLYDVTVYFGDAAPIVSMLVKEPDVKDKDNAKKLVDVKGNIEFKDVCFTYPSSDQPVFSNLSFSVREHERVGIVGRSGAGKSSLVKILMRFVDIDSGSILIDGINNAEVTQSSLRSSIAYVPQEPMLFHRTVRENITYGIDGVTQDNIDEVLSRSHSDEFVASLPKGLDSIVGERGVNLSGGQRQRISIARAMLKNAPILVLDEATSALDSESEQYVQSAFGELTKNRTTLVIAHRLSTLMDMDRILVFDFGEIIEEGTHSELLENHSMYASLWKHQAGGFLPQV